MSDAPTVHGTPEPHVHPGIGGFFKNNTLGLPNWAWLLVIAAGIGAAIIIPKLIGGKSGNATTTGTTPDSGLGLAIDPTTGLPYAVEGLVPAGGTAGGGTQGPPGPPGPPGQPGPSQTFKLNVRPRFFRPEYKAYDTAHPQGVQVFDKPGGKPVGFLSYGSTTETGTGPITVGKDVWYKLTNGEYVLQQDVLPVAPPFSASTTGSMIATQVTTNWPGDTTQTRMIV
jgi:hypothetical protein